jgi:ribosomal protein S18 acetylase RimI-like enzyme
LESLITANLEVEAKRLALRELYLETGGNLLSAIRLYKKLGFAGMWSFSENIKKAHIVFLCLRNSTNAFTSSKIWHD